VEEGTTQIVVALISEVLAASSTLKKSFRYGNVYREIRRVSRLWQSSSPSTTKGAGFGNQHLGRHSPSDVVDLDVVGLRQIDLALSAGNGQLPAANLGAARRCAEGRRNGVNGSALTSISRA
jgi:hypothetical protein